MKIKVPKFETQEELFDYLVKNVDEHIYQKKLAIKEADSTFGTDVAPILILEGETYKGDTLNKDTENPDELMVKAIINTTNLMDSHDDVHIKGLWDKSLKENKRLKHIQEHEMKFDKVISDKTDLKGYVEEFTWKELGYDIEGKTQALVFDSNVKKSRNSFMFSEYKQGNVDNHSVGMRYVKLYFAMNSEKEHHATYKDAWDKYYPEIANKAQADRKGYFYAVTEAKAIEGSAVVNGSNHITPTLSAKEEDIKVIENKELDAVKAFLGLD